MTLTDKLKILDDKIKASQTQYDLGREAAIIPALLSKELDKYKYLTGKYLGFKSGVVEQTKSEYSPSRKVFNEGLDKKRQRRKNFEKVKKYRK